MKSSMIIVLTGIGYAFMALNILVTNSTILTSAINSL
jgi:hypothetical protein